jgi:putative acetyltransferase
MTAIGNFHQVHDATGVALFDDYAEVKRMYTRLEARGRGLAKALLRKIEGETLGSGKSLLRLETGPHQQQAIGLYQSMGFRPCSASVRTRPCRPVISR